MRDVALDRAEVYSEACKWWLLVYWTAFGFFAKTIWSDVCHKTSSLSMRLLIQALCSVHTLSGAIAALLPGEYWLSAEVWPGRVENIDWVLGVRMISYLGIPFAMMHCYINIGYQWAGITSKWGCFRACISIVAILWVTCFFISSIDSSSLPYPIAYFFVTYYLLVLVVQFCCWWVVLQLWRLEACTLRHDTAWWVILQQSPFLLEVVVYNLVAAIDAFLLLLLHLDLAFSHFVSQPDDVLRSLFLVRYVAILGLLNPFARTIKPSNVQVPMLGHDPLRNMRLKKGLRFNHVMSRSYDLDSGIALVICNSKYKVPLYGNDVDADFYLKSFKLIGFETELHRDVQGAKLLDDIGGFMDKAHTRGFHAVALAYVGHGNRVDGIIGVDDIPVSIAEVCHKINEHNFSRSGQPKPKMLVFDCCRGGRSGWVGWRRLSRFVHNIVRRICPFLRDASGAMPGMHRSEANIDWRSRPLQSDFVLCYSTADGIFGASSHPYASSPFAKSLSERMKELATCELEQDQLPYDITDALRYSIGDVFRGVYGARSKQCLFFQSSLSRRFELRSRPAGQSKPNPLASQPSMSHASSQPNSLPSHQSMNPPNNAVSQSTTQSSNLSSSQVTNPPKQPTNQSNSQSPSQSTSQLGQTFASQSTSQVTSQPAHQSTCQSTQAFPNQSASQSSNQFNNQPTGHVTNLPKQPATGGVWPATQSSNQLIKQPTSQPTQPLAIQSTSQPSETLPSQPKSQSDNEITKQSCSQATQQLSNQLTSQPTSQTTKSTTEATAQFDISTPVQTPRKYTFEAPKGHVFSVSK